MLHPYLRPVREHLSLLSDPLRAEGASAYMRHQFPFFGVPMPELRTYAKGLFKQGLPNPNAIPDIVDAAWSQPEREFQYLAIWLLRATRKQWDKGTITLAEDMITRKSWWDTVDAIASDITGPFFQDRPGRIATVTGRWKRARNFWLQRSSLLYQKAWKKDTDRERLAGYILQVSDSKEFFVQKAIGWALREYAKTDPAWVGKFVKAHQEALPALAKREALKHIGRMS